MIGAIAPGFHAFPFSHAQKRNIQIREKMTHGFFNKTWHYVYAGSVCMIQQHIKKLLRAIVLQCTVLCSECALCLHFIPELAKQLITSCTMRSFIPAHSTGC